MMFYKTTKAMVDPPAGNAYFFDIVAGVLQGYTSAPYLFIIYLDYVLQTPVDLIKENGFTLKKGKQKKYPIETMINLDNTDDLVHLVNTPAQAKSLWHSLEQAVIGLYLNANKTEFMSFEWERAISTLSGRPLKLII